MAKRLWWGCVIAIALLVGCGDDDSGGGASGTAAGSGGSAGTAGTGGTGGSGGDAGSAGTAGTGGSAGTAGSGGDGGTAGTAGSGGDGGSAGTAGSGGDGGSAGTAGSGGDGGSAGTAGSGGDGGSAGTGGTGGDGGTGGSYVHVGSMPCCTVHADSAGCADATVEECVCGFDSRCCNDTFGWTLECVTLARADVGNCGSCKGSCCEGKTSPGCDDEDIEECVCGAIPECCNAAWDSQCAAVITMNNVCDPAPNERCE